MDGTLVAKVGLRWKQEDEVLSSSRLPTTGIVKRNVVRERRNTLLSGRSWSSVFVADTWPRWTENRGMKRSPRSELQYRRDRRPPVEATKSTALRGSRQVSVTIDRPLSGHDSGTDAPIGLPCKQAPRSQRRVTPAGRDTQLRRENGPCAGSMPARVSNLVSATVSGHGGQGTSSMTMA